jgi:hypothetical protein
LLHRRERGLACFGDGNKRNMVVLRNGKRRSAGLEPPVRIFGQARTCAVDGCATKLSRYNPASCCTLHQGWDQRPVTRHGATLGISRPLAQTSSLVLLRRRCEVLAVVDRSWGLWEFDPEGGALSDSTGQVEAAAHRLGQALGKGKAQAGAFNAGRITAEPFKRDE